MTNRGLGFVIFLLAVALTVLVMANFGGYVPAIMKIDRGHIVAPPVQKRAPSSRFSNKQPTPAPAPKEDLTPPAPAPKPQVPCNCTSSDGPTGPPMNVSHYEPAPQPAQVQRQVVQQVQYMPAPQLQQSDSSAQFFGNVAGSFLGSFLGTTLNGNYYGNGYSYYPPTAYYSALQSYAPKNYRWNHGQTPPPGSTDNPIVWRRYVMPGGRETYVPGPWRQ